ncbi:MAG: hypothetical protein WDN28_15465 [Chthoniobacter sp.]
MTTSPGDPSPRQPENGRFCFEPGDRIQYPREELAALAVAELPPGVARQDGREIVFEEPFELMLLPPRGRHSPASVSTAPLTSPSARRNRDQEP